MIALLIYAAVHLFCAGVFLGIALTDPPDERKGWAVFAGCLLLAPVALVLLVLAMVEQREWTD